MNWKSKPVLIGGGVVVFILVLLIAGGSKSDGGTTNVTTGPSGEQLASQTSLALAQISAGVEQSKVNAQLTALQYQSQGEMATAELSANLTRYQIDQQAVQSARQDTLSADIARAQIASSDRATDATTAIQKYTLDQAYALQVSNNNFQLDQAQIASGATITMANITAALTRDQITANAAITNNALQAGIIRDQINADYMRDVNDSNNAAQVSVVTSSYAAAVEQARISGNTSVQIANAQASAQKHSSTLGAIGGIIGGVLSIFSVYRLKTDIIKVAECEDGLGIYSYRYKDEDMDALRTIGVMAHEVAALQPQALGPRIGGFQTVNYAI